MAILLLSSLHREILSQSMKDYLVLWSVHAGVILLAWQLNSLSFFNA